MSEEEALLAAIAAHPEEDTPRLVYADWLDEHGQPLRAEFIRVQVEVSRVETLPRIDINRHVDLYRRQHDLLENHRGELLEPLSLPREALVEFERGFPCEVTFTVRTFLRNQLRLADVRPLPRVVIADSVHRVLSLFDRRAGLLLARESVAAIRTREDRRNARGASRTGEFIVPQGSPWPRLDELDLSGCRLGDMMAASLLRAKTFPALADLDVSANGLTDVVVTSLLDSGLASQLKRLILGGNAISDEGAIELAERWPAGDQDRLEIINLRRTNIWQPGQQALLARFGGRVILF